MEINGKTKGKQWKLMEMKGDQAVFRPRSVRSGLGELPLPPAFTVAVAACDRASLWQEVRAFLF